jgi:hypothetical protein
LVLPREVFQVLFSDSLLTEYASRCGSVRCGLSSCAETRSEVTLSISFVRSLRPAALENSMSVRVEGDKMGLRIVE